MFRGIGRLVVLTDDQQQALDFYRGVLGFVVLHDSTVGDFRYLHVGVPGQEHVGLWIMPALDPTQHMLMGNQAGGGPLLVLYTDDLAAVRERLVAHGVGIWGDRTDASSASLQFRDVMGNTLIAAQLPG